MASKAGWPRSTYGSTAAWSSIELDCWSSTACVRTRSIWKAAMPAPIRTAFHEGVMAGEMTTPRAILMALGAFHGLNPGMGWLFAVALGMQERRRGAVIRALMPLGAGHAVAVAVAVGAAVAVGFAIPLAWLRWPIAGVLVSLGAWRFFRHRHPRCSGMRVSMGKLTVWSFLMATAHGAGLMVVP